MTYRRPDLAVRAPDRAVGGYYRSASSGADGASPGGIPLRTGEDVAVAIVRAANRLTNKQIERSREWGRRWRDAAAHQGISGASVPGSNASALRRLIDLAADGLQAVTTIPVADLIGARRGGKGGGAADDPDMMRLLHRLMDILERDATGTGAPAPAPQSGASPTPLPAIEFEAVVRYVEWVEWKYFGASTGDIEEAVQFRREGMQDQTLGARLLRGERPDEFRLVLALDANTPEGRWKAAICSRDRRLLGSAILVL